MAPKTFSTREVRESVSYGHGMFRTPDVDAGDTFLWYGPGGVEGDHCTEVTLSGQWATVREYTNVQGLLEDPPEAFLVTSTQVRVPRAFRPELAARYAASVGSASLSYWGGDETWADSLPA